jgi:hypothetical protein
MPRSVIMSVGMSWGWPGTRTCGISVGHAGGLRRLTQSAVQRLRAPASGGRFAAWSAWLVAGLPYSADSGEPDRGRLLARCLPDRWRMRAHAGRRLGCPPGVTMAPVLAGCVWALGDRSEEPVAAQG